MHAAAAVPVAVSQLEPLLSHVFHVPAFHVGVVLKARLSHVVDVSQTDWASRERVSLILSSLYKL